MGSKTPHFAHLVSVVHAQTVSQPWPRGALGRGAGRTCPVARAMSLELTGAMFERGGGGGRGGSEGAGTGLSADVLGARGLGGGELKSRRRERESVDIPSTRRRDASIQNCFNAVAFHVLTVLGNGQSPESELSRTNYVLAGSLDCRALSARCLLPTAELEPMLSFKKFFYCS